MLRLTGSSALRGLQAVEPIVGVAFGVGDREHSDFCLELKKHERIWKSGEQGTSDI